jgi:hypothetical protein
MDHAADALKIWLSSNRLRFNNAKTQYIWLGTQQQLSKLDLTSLANDFPHIVFSTSVRDLGIILDQQLSFSGHIHALSRACFYQLRQLRVVTRSLSFASASLLVHAFVCSRLDYCSSLYAGLPLNKLNCLTKILRSSARLVGGISRFDHVSDFMRDKLHWLPIFQRIRFRLACIAKSCINSLGPSYLCELFVPVTATLARRSLRSASRGDFLVPFARTAKTKSRSFSVAGPTLWNDLPSYLRSTSSVSSGSFHNHLKTFLFDQNCSGQGLRMTSFN